MENCFDRQGKVERCLSGIPRSATGVVLRAKPGDRVSAGDALADLAVGAHAQVEQALELAASAYVIAAEPPAPAPLVLGVVA